MHRLNRLIKSISQMNSEEYAQWAMDLRQSRRTPKIIHKKQTKTSSGKTRKPRAPKAITTRSGSKAIAKMLSKEAKAKLIKELTGK